jgi:hypothetical protein
MARAELTRHRETELAEARVIAAASTSTGAMPGSEVADSRRRELWWEELRGIIQQVYAEATQRNKDVFAGAPFERAYALVCDLAEHDVGTLFVRLEREAQDRAEAIRVSIVAAATRDPDQAGAVTAAHIDQLLAANDVLAGVLMRFHNAFLRQFRVTFGDVALGAVRDTVLLDPVVGAMLAKHRPADRALAAAERVVRDGAARWRKARDAVLRAA